MRDGAHKVVAVGLTGANLSPKLQIPNSEQPFRLRGQKNRRHYSHVNGNTVDSGRNDAAMKICCIVAAR